MAGLPRRAKRICDAECLLYKFTSSQDRGHSKQPAPPPGPIPVQGDQAAKLYCPINNWQTRIVKLYPGSVGDETVIDLFVADLILAEGIVNHALQEKITYAALSYSWGEPLFNSLILVNGLPFPVTENLYLALQRLRLSDRPRYLWIDALCITQHDVNERSMQVRNILDIFKKAERVLVWLGEYDDETSFCLDNRAALMRSLNVEDGDHRNGDSSRPKSLYDDISSPDMNQKDDLLVKNLCKAHVDPIYQGMKRLFNKPWYARIWVRQVVWGARAIDVHCGEYQLQWNALQRLARLASKLRERVYLDRPFEYDLETLFKDLRQADYVTLAVVDYPQLTDLVRHKTLIHQPPLALDLMDVIQRTSDCQYSDKRDRIYGILGMIPAISRQDVDGSPPSYRLAIDYNLSTAQVFVETATYMMQSDRDCSVLRLNGTFGGMVEGNEPPSWCPDWTKHFGKGPGHAGKYPKKSIHKDLTFDGRKLHLAGVQIGSVTSMSAAVVVEFEVHPTCKRVEAVCFAARPVKEKDLIVEWKGGDLTLVLRPSSAVHFQFVGRIGGLLERYTSYANEAKEGELSERWFTIT